MAVVAPVLSPPFPLPSPPPPLFGSAAADDVLDVASVCARVRWVVLMTVVPGRVEVTITVVGPAWVTWPSAAVLETTRVEV